LRQSTSTVPGAKHSSWLSYCLEPDSLRFSLKMALIVGTILAIINHGYSLLTGHFTAGEIYPLLLTYCVPFTVSMIGQIQGKRQRDQARIISDNQSNSKMVAE
jgi:hypothetical protein